MSKKSRIEKKIVMKSNWQREQLPSHDLFPSLSKDLGLVWNVSECCKAEMIKIAGSYKCTACDNYCKAIEK